MLEKHIILNDIVPQMFYGPQNANLRMLKSLFPKLRLVARDNVIKVVGEDSDLADFEAKVQRLVAHCATFNRLSAEDIVEILKGERTEGECGQDGTLLYSTTGRPVRPRNANQERLVHSFEANDLIFATGPAGTGKTYLSIALAVRAFKKKQVRRIILSRPAVEAGEKLGFLPGDMRDKIDPYLQPLYDALEEMLPHQRLQELMDQNVIQIAPLAFMRGRTLNDAVVILDEAQNTTRSQLKMFLTRMGSNTKMIVTGDTTQIDLPTAQRSGLVEALRILRPLRDVAIVEFTRRDIVRHKLVTHIVEAYEREDREAAAAAPSE
ncbi:MAG: PhoH family protein [Bacteroidaceae bacterium]|nr:PhoH family protein [Bacteroidaceae bacterium]